jgi:pyruvate dehydrogenase E1 component beta subunit
MLINGFKYLFCCSKIDLHNKNMRTIQFREAICEAMSEEMRNDESIYLMGEEVAEYNGAYKASKGMLAEFGEKRVIDTLLQSLVLLVLVGSSVNGW